MNSIKEETLSGIKWSALEKFTLQGIQFLLGLIMARLLVPSDYGTVAIVGIFIGFSSLFIDSGFGSALVRKENCSEADFSTVFYFSMVIALFCYIFLFIIAPLVADFFSIPVLCSVLRIQSIAMFLNAISTIPSAKLTRALKFDVIAKRSVAASLISGIIGVLCAYYGLGIWSLVIQSLMSTILNVSFTWWYCHWMPKLMYSWQSFHEMFSYGSKLLAAGFIESIYGHLNTFVIAKFYTPKDLGYYNRGTQIATYPVSNINGVLQKVTFPILAKIQNDKDHLIDIYRKYIRTASLLIFFGCCLLTSIAKPLVLIVLTEKWADAIIYLQIFSFAIMFDHICNINVNLLLVIGRSDLNLRLNIIKKIISIAILLVSVPFGVMTICFSKVIYSQIAIFINTYYTGKLFNLGYQEQLKDFSPYLLFSILSCLPSFLIVTYIELPYFFSLIVGIALSTSLYLIFIRKDTTFHEVKKIIERKVLHLNK